MFCILLFIRKVATTVCPHSAFKDMIEFVRNNFQIVLILKIVLNQNGYLYIVVRGQMCLHCKYIIEVILLPPTKSILKAKFRTLPNVWTAKVTSPFLHLLLKFYLPRETAELGAIGGRDVPPSICSHWLIKFINIFFKVCA